KGQVRYTIASNYIDSIEDSAIRQAIETIRNRVDKFGVTEPSIVRKGSDIVIELPGLKEADFERIKAAIGRAPPRAFKMVDDTEVANAYMRLLEPLIPKDSGIEMRPHQWPEKDSSREHTNVVFAGKTRDQLEKFFASLPKDKQPPSGDEIGYEEVNPRE